MCEMRQNPFKPSAGVNPPLLVGREQVLADFEQGLFNGAGDPHRLLRITGNRGAGKTVLLNALGEQAELLKWLVIHETPHFDRGHMHERPISNHKTHHYPTKNF